MMSEKVRQEAYYREKRLHDEASALKGARREGEKIGYERGRAEGWAEGRDEGKNEMKIQLMERWRTQGMSEDEIRALLGE